MTSGFFFLFLFKSYYSGLFIEFNFFKKRLVHKGYNNPLSLYNNLTNYNQYIQFEFIYIKIINILNV